MQVNDPHFHLKCHSPQVLFTHFANANLETSFSISRTLATNGLKVLATAGILPPAHFQCERIKRFNLDDWMKMVVKDTLRFSELT